MPLKAGKWGMHRRSPLRGAWIEIYRAGKPLSASLGRSPLRGAWIEIGYIVELEICAKSLPLAGSVD